MKPEVRQVKKCVCILLLGCLLCGCGALPSELEPIPAPVVSLPAPTIPETTPETTVPPDPIEELLEQLTVEELVGQLLLARCSKATALTDLDTFHLGGLVLFGADFQDETPSSIRATLASYQSGSRVPLLLAVDEEGGTVNRISRYSAFRYTPFPSLRKSWKAGGLEQILEIEEEKCQLLKELGLNVNLGPVCDISDDPNAFMYDRSLGQNAETTAEVISQIVLLYQQQGVGSVLKHFPGYGNNADTHTGIAVDSRTLEELENRDLVPFAAGIEAGCSAILVSHTIVQALDEETPASLSPAVHQYLRQTLGFDGVIVTDDLVMEAITKQYGAGEAAVLAVLAGNDLLCVTDYAEQYQALLDAVYTGRIDYDTLHNAAYRVLQWKQELGLI